MKSKMNNIHITRLSENMFVQKPETWVEVTNEKYHEITFIITKDGINIESCHEDQNRISSFSFDNHKLISILNDELNTIKDLLSKETPQH